MDSFDGEEKPKCLLCELSNLQPLKSFHVLHYISTKKGGACFFECFYIHLLKSVHVWGLHVSTRNTDMQYSCPAHVFNISLLVGAVSYGRLKLALYHLHIANISQLT